MNAAARLQPVPSRRLKIAQVATSDVSVRLLLLENIEMLAQAGHQVIAVCSASEHMDFIRSHGVPVEVVPMRREPHPQDMVSLFALARCFRRHRFDVVHTHTPKAGLLGPLAARMAAVPIVVHTIFGLLLHDSQPRWRQLLYWLPEKFTSANSDYLLSQSHEDIGVAASWNIAAAPKIEYLGNGVDVQHFRPPAPAEREAARAAFGISPDQFAIGCVGRLVYEKGFTELFSIAAQIRNKYPRAGFFVVGPEEPDQSDAIPRSFLRKLQEQGDIKFLGWRDDMLSFYAALDLFVLPSHREGIPRACMEAAACGVPVIASDIRGCREVVRNGETGLLVPVKNPEALATAIAAIISNPERGRSMGIAGRKHIVEQFDRRQVLARLYSLYENIAQDLENREQR